MTALAVFVLVVSTILAPLVLGIVVRSLLPSFADRAAKPIEIVATVLLIASALPVLLGSMRTIYSLFGDGTVIAMAAFALLGLIIGHFLGGPEPERRSVLALATASRHPAMAIAIAHTNFPGLKLAAAAVFLYLILSAILSSVYFSWAKRATLAAETAKTQVG
jgi:bile acid:Na+ symporter, BASS family